MAVSLIETLKTYLDITWNDPHSNAKLEGILARAQAKLREYAGCSAEELTFEDNTAEQQLLLDLCRYIYNNASEDFEGNYREDLIMLRAKYAVEVTDDENDEASESENSG